MTNVSAIFRALEIILKCLLALTTPGCAIFPMIVLQSAICLVEEVLTCIDTDTGRTKTFRQ